MALCRKIQLPLILTSVAALFWAAAPTSISASAPSHTTSDQALAQQIGDRLTRVPEFEFIRQEAERLGVRAYLFGGTAAGYAHYVKQDLDRENGDIRYSNDRFDYDYTNIYRSTQDADIVIDGSPEKAKQLQDLLASRYDHLQGGKSNWEVRLLRERMGDKQALLNDPNFLNQHTDSNSTGMIEITKPGKGEPVVRDLRDWNSKAPFFLRDVREGKIHYYFSPLHETTEFATQGRNPPILSVIRFLTKAFQFDLKIRDEDLVTIRKIIADFDPRGKEMQNDYVRHWVLNKENARKLIKNAVDVEYASQILNELGLKKKLVAIENNPDTQQSLAWWLEKEPLRSHAVGIDPKTGKPGTGKTAAELAAEGRLPKDLIVAHETKDFTTYEAMTQSRYGAPNVFISRNGKPGEWAAEGDGFYTLAGHKGMRGTGMTIKFKVDPNAREGVDFTLHEQQQVLFQNKKSLRVFEESLKPDLVEFFRMIKNGQIGLDNLGTLERLKRRLRNQKHNITEEQRKELKAILLESLEDPKQSPWVVEQWLSLGDWLKLERPLEPRMSDWFEKFVRSYTHAQFVDETLWQSERIIALASKRASDPGELSSSAIQSLKSLANGSLNFIEKGDINRTIGGQQTLPLEIWMALPQSASDPAMFDRLVSENSLGTDQATLASRWPHWEQKATYFIPSHIRNASDEDLFRFMYFIMGNQATRSHPEWIEEIVRLRSDYFSKPHKVETLNQILLKPHWQNNEALTRFTGQRPSTFEGIVNAIKNRKTLRKPIMSENPSCASAVRNSLIALAPTKMDPALQTQINQLTRDLDALNQRLKNGPTFHRPLRRYDLKTGILGAGAAAAAAATGFNLYEKLTQPQIQPSDGKR